MKAAAGMGTAAGLQLLPNKESDRQTTAPQVGIACRGETHPVAITASAGLLGAASGFRLALLGFSGRATRTRKASAGLHAGLLQSPGRLPGGVAVVMEGKRGAQGPRGKPRERKTARFAKGRGCCNRKYHRCISSSACGQHGSSRCPTSRESSGRRGDPDRRTHPSTLTSTPMTTNACWAAQPPPARHQWLDQIPRAHPGQCALEGGSHQSPEIAPCQWPGKARHGSHRLSRTPSPATSNRQEDRSRRCCWRTNLALCIADLAYPVRRGHSLPLIPRRHWAGRLEFAPAGIGMRCELLKRRREQARRLMMPRSAAGMWG